MDFKKYIGMRWADIADMEDEENVFVDQNKIKNQQYDPFLDASSKDGFNLMLKKGLGLHSEDSMDSPKGVAKEPIKNPSTWKEDGRSFAQVVSANKTPVTTTMPFSSSTPQRVETTSTTSTNSLKRMHSSPSTKTSNKLLKTQEFGDKKNAKEVVQQKILVVEEESEYVSKYEVKENNQQREKIEIISTQTITMQTTPTTHQETNSTTTTTSSKIMIGEVVVENNPNEAIPSSPQVKVLKNSSSSTNLSSSKESDQDSLSESDSDKDSLKKSTPKEKKKKKTYPKVWNPETQKFESPKELDPHKISQRSKQLELGLKTESYKIFCLLVPEQQRTNIFSSDTLPVVPDANQFCSTRAWNGQIAKWRRLLHNYDREKLSAEDLTKLEKLEKNV